MLALNFGATHVEESRIAAVTLLYAKRFSFHLRLMQFVFEAVATTTLVSSDD